MAFKTKVKSPNVRIVIGRVNINRTGLMNALIIPKTSATTNAVLFYASRFAKWGYNNCVSGKGYLHR